MNYVKKINVQSLQLMKAINIVKNANKIIFYSKKIVMKIVLKDIKQIIQQKPVLIAMTQIALNLLITLVNALNVQMNIF
jgi:hypothetical protein